MPVTQEHRSLRRSSAAVTGAFAAHAVVSGLLGPWTPQLKDRAGIDASGLGVALSGYAAGLLVGTRLAGPFVRRVGGRAAVRAGIPVLAGTAALLPLATGLASLTGLFVAFGLAAGLVDVAMNIEAVEVERRSGRRVMTAIHGAWSISLFVGAGISSLGIAAEIPIVVHLPAVAAAVAGASIPLLAALPRAESAPAGAGEPDGHRSPRAMVALLGTIAACAFLLEGIAMEWSAVYLRDGLGAVGGVVGLSAVAFSGGMASTRFVGDRFVGPFGQPSVVRAGATVAVLALGTMLLVPSVAVSIVAFAVVGLGMGPVVPLAFRSAGRTARPRGGSALPIVVTAGYTGSIVGPALVGPLADAFGLRAAFVVPVVACAVVAVAAPATATSAPGQA